MFYHNIILFETLYHIIHFTSFIFYLIIVARLYLVEEIPGLHFIIR